MLHTKRLSRIREYGQIKVVTRARKTVREKG